MRFIERVLADEFVATYGDGTRGDKAAEMAQTLDFDQRVDSSVLDSFRVRIYGETAVVWFSRHMTGPKSGKIVAVTYRFVDVFVKRAGRWQCVSSQSTRSISAVSRPARSTSDISWWLASISCGRTTDEAHRPVLVAVVARPRSSDPRRRFRAP